MQRAAAVAADRYPAPTEESYNSKVRNLERRITLLEQAQYERTSCCSNTMTRAAMVQTQRLQGTVTHSTEFDAFLEEHTVAWWPLGATRRFPTVGAAECPECQTFVHEMLSTVTAKTVKVEWRNHRQSKRVTLRSCPDRVAFRQISKWPRSPDAVFFDGDTRREATVTMVGEVTDHRRGDFADEEVGQLIRSLMRLLHRQLFRTTVMGFVTDGNRFLFVRGVRYSDDGALRFDTSRMFRGADGWQRLFGLMTVDPAVIGYTPLVLPGGYLVDRLLGKGAFSVVYKAIPTADRIATRASSSSSSPTQVRRRPPQLPAAWAVHRVLGDGNGFFYALADQLQRHDIRDASGARFTLEALRQLTLRGVSTQPHLRALLIDEELDLARLCGALDLAAVAAMAVTLQQDIVLYHPDGIWRCDPSGGQHVHHRDRACSRREKPPLRVEFNDHYDSVVPAPTPVPAEEAPSIKRRRLAAATSTSPSHVAEPPPRPTTVSSTAPPPTAVAVKVFHPQRRAMRDNERAMLTSLAPHRHVSVVLDGCDLSDDGPAALLLTPVGRPVLPIPGGVRAGVSDYLNLLTVLEHAHRRGICHRDVKPHNIFIDDAPGGCGVFLSDWGSAARTGERTSWAGTDYFYTRQREAHCPLPADDLVALVRTIFLLFTNQSPSEAALRYMAHSPRWQEAIRLAHLCDYDALRNVINNF